MALLTQRAILSTFEEMLEEMPFDKITVSALVKRCGVSANTFYYHYQDIYALLDAWLTKKIGEIREKTRDESDWKIEGKAILLTCQNHSRIIEHILNSLSRERMEWYVFTQMDDVFNELVRIRTAGKELTEEQIEEIATFLRYAFLGVFLKANRDHFKGDIDYKVERMGVMFNSFVDSVSDTMKK